eukprot:Em0018g1227a
MEVVTGQVVAPWLSVLRLLFHLWVVRVSLRWSPSATPVPGDTISSATEQILIQTERQVNDAVTFLSSVCDKAPQDMALPTPSLSLPLPNQNGGKAFYTLGPPLGEMHSSGDAVWSQGSAYAMQCGIFWREKEISPRVMQLLSRGERKILDYFVHICKQALLTNQTQQSLNRLQSFVRIMCCSVDMSVDIGGLAVQGLVAAEDEQLLHSHLPGSSVTPPSVDFSVQEECDIIAKVPQLERQLLWATTPQALLSAIDELFKFLAPPEQRAFVQKWSGFGKGYASQENIPDPILLVKYNALVRRSTFLRTAKLYATSLEFLHEALKLLTTKCSPYVKPQLEPGLQEQKFTIELLTAISQKDKAVGSLSAQQQQLADKAQIYYKESQTDGSMDPVSISVVGAFLLNARRYSFLAL